MSPRALATTSVPTLTQNGNRVSLQAAEQLALEIGVPIIAVVDAHTHLLTFTRMDGAKITSINIAMDIAFTAAGKRIQKSAFYCSTGPSHKDEAAAKAGRDAVLALIRKEKVYEERRVENECQAVLMLRKKRIRLHKFRGRKKGSISLSDFGNLSETSGMGLLLDTPPQEGEMLPEEEEIPPSFVGKVLLGRA
ncbi:hypothetical protein BDU57DRAFT_555744 [Ampelomyces quisqualis]|uniref:Uncharacterized protein n=1 Tax=Ampelomyces quisqualis TaxID=50730 RepID=A0A6A5QRL5_AMPQU|nr:hypothetical protein BDU57DRAFT_555744 [Ampelomyces quisqualis]